MSTRLNRLATALSEAVLTSNHNLCFGSKIRKIGILLISQFYYIKLGFKWVYITRTRFLDALHLELDPKPGQRETVWDQVQFYSTMSTALGQRNQSRNVQPIDGEIMTVHTQRMQELSVAMVNTTLHSQ